MSTININNADAIYFGDRPVDRIYLGTQRVWPWTPALLFQNGEQGGFWDFTNPNGLFQDAGGTLPVGTYGDPIGMAMDLSGNGLHLFQATTPARPAYTEDGAGHDGVDDFLGAENAEDWTFLHDGSGGTLAVVMLVEDVDGSVGNKTVGTRTNNQGMRLGVANTTTMQGMLDVNNGSVTTSANSPLAERGEHIAYIGQAGPGGIRVFSNYGDSALVPVAEWGDSSPHLTLRTLTTPAGRPVRTRRMLAINRTLTESERASVNAWLMEGVE